MRKFLNAGSAIAAIMALAYVSGANAQSNRMGNTMSPDTSSSVETLTTIPMNAVTVNNWLKQNVYDPTGAKIGEVQDILVSDGKIEAAIVAVGGFIGIGEKDVAVPFSSVQWRERDGKSHLTMNVTKDALKAAPGFKFDKSNTTWKTS